jgi:hypothetical protein
VACSFVLRKDCPAAHMVWLVPPFWLRWELGILVIWQRGDMGDWDSKMSNFNVNG